MLISMLRKVLASTWQQLDSTLKPFQNWHLHRFCQHYHMEFWQDSTPSSPRRQYIKIFYLDEVIDDPGGWSDVFPDIFVYLIRFSEFYSNTAYLGSRWMSKMLRHRPKAFGTTICEPQLLARCSVPPLIIEQTSAPTFALTCTKVANN